MAYVWLTDLDQALATAGIDYVEVGATPIDPTYASSWRDRGRPSSTGPFAPEGVLCHHTASAAGTSDQAELNVIICGNGSAPGPISQLFIGRSATLYIVAAGRANHGGKGAIPGEGCDDMNARLLGIEVANNGVGEWWSDEVTEIYGATVAALCEWYGWPTSMVLLHATTGPPCGNYKIDPAGPWQRQPDIGGATWNLDTWRGFVDEHRGGHAPPTQPEDDDVPMPCPMLIQPDGSDGTYPGAVYATDGRFQTIRWIQSTWELDDIRYWLRAAGMSDAITWVARRASYGILVGPEPQSTFSVEEPNRQSLEPDEPE